MSQITNTKIRYVYKNKFLFNLFEYFLIFHLSSHFFFHPCIPIPIEQIVIKEMFRIFFAKIYLHCKYLIFDC